MDTDDEEEDDSEEEHEFVADFDESDEEDLEASIFEAYVLSCERSLLFLYISFNALNFLHGVGWAMSLTLDNHTLSSL